MCWMDVASGHDECLQMFAILSIPLSGAVLAPSPSPTPLFLFSSCIIGSGRPGDEARVAYKSLGCSFE